MINEKLIKEKESKLLLTYISSSVASMVGLSICIFFDTMFIGRKFGEVGLAALNIAIPTFAIICSLGLIVGVGGATLFSIYLGKKNLEKAREIFQNSFVAMILISIILMVLGLYFLKDICYLLGATSETYSMVYSYLKIIFTFNFAFVFMNGLAVFVRADNSPKKAMVGIIVANILNIILDYLLLYVFNLGFKGAAIATITGQSIGLLIIFTHFLKKKNNLKIKFRFSIKIIFNILKYGVASFINELSQGLIILFFNLVILRVSGEIALSAYGVIANVALVAVAVLNGIAQGMQPLVSINYGAKKEERVNNFLKLSIKVSLIVGVLFFIVVLIFTKPLINVFLNSYNEQLYSIAKSGLRLYFLAFLFMGFNIIYIAYFQSTRKANLAFILSILRGFVFVIILLLTLSKILTLNGVWITIPITEMLTMLVIIFYNKKGYRIL